MAASVQHYFVKVSVCVDSARQPVPSPLLSYVTRPNHSAITAWFSFVSPSIFAFYFFEKNQTGLSEQIGRQTQRHPDRHTDIQATTQTFRQTHTHSARHTNIQPDTQTFGQTHKHSDRHPNIQADTQACRQTYKHSNRNTNIQADSHAGRHATEIQAIMQADRKFRILQRCFLKFLKMEQLSLIIELELEHYSAFRFHVTFYFSECILNSSLHWTLPQATYCRSLVPV